MHLKCGWGNSHLTSTTCENTNLTPKHAQGPAILMNSRSILSLLPCVLIRHNSTILNEFLSLLIHFSHFFLSFLIIHNCMLYTFIVFAYCVHCMRHVSHNQYRIMVFVRGVIITTSEYLKVTRERGKRKKRLKKMQTNFEREKGK